MKLGIIGGTNADFALESAHETVIDTLHGSVDAVLGTLRASGTEAVFIRRHGRGHSRLSSLVNHRANVAALGELGCSAIIATTVCGVLDPAVPLARPIIFDDLFFPDNRLPEGGPCTFFTEEGQEGRGHYIFGSPFSAGLRDALLSAADAAGMEVYQGGTYAYQLGPRFNTGAEVAWIRSCGAVAVSQTAGPEAMLAGELEMPYALVGFGVDYANGVQAQPTPTAVLDANIAESRDVLPALLEGAARLLEDARPSIDGFVYRF